MSADTLVLNKSWYSIHLIDWRRAVSLLFQGHAEALDDNLNTYDFDTWKELSQQMVEHPNGFIHTVSYKIAVPEVIRLVKFDRLPKAEVKFTRKNIYQHYHYRCCYCGVQHKTEDLNLDHVIPKSKGGRTDWSNIVTACIPCNSRKSDRTPEEVGMKLLTVPSKPRWKGSKSLLDSHSPLKVKVSWQKLIDSKYWGSELQND